MQNQTGDGGCTEDRAKERRERSKRQVRCLRHHRYEDPP